MKASRLHVWLGTLAGPPQEAGWECRKWQMVKHNLRYFMENANSMHVIKTVTESYSNEKPMMYVLGVLRSPLHGLPAEESHQERRPGRYGCT